MSGYAVRRVLQAIPVMVGVTIMVFFMIHLVPGDPARNVLGTHATPEAIDALHQRWGLDRPLIEQYWLFMSRLVRGDLGESLVYRVPAASLIVERLPATLWLIGGSTFLSVALAVPLASLAATKPDGVRDHVVRFVPLIGLGFPSFWIGILLLMLVALPSGGAIPVGGFGDSVPEHVASMLLPCLAVSLAIAPILIRSLRASLIEVLDADYITTARSKGVSERRVIVRHALRSGVISTVAVLGVNVAYLVGSTLVVEQVFALPGVGALMIDAIDARDYPVVQGVTLLFAFMVVMIYIVTDLVHAALDPRVSLDRWQ